MNRSQKKTLLILLAAVAVLIAALLIVRAAKERSARQAEEEAAAEEAAGVITEEAAYSALSYDNGTTALSFALDEEGNWTWADDPEFPLDDTTVTAMVDLLTSLKPQQTITEGDTLEAYGLDDPFATLTATTPEGETLTLDFGNATTDGTSYYMLMNGQESPVYIVADTLYNYMCTAIYDMCALPELPLLTEERILSVTVSGAETWTLTPDEGEDEDGNEIVTWQCGGEDVTDAAADLIDELKALTVTKCVDYKPTDQAVTICGFDEPVKVTLVYLTDSGTEQTLTLQIGTENLDGDGYYVRVDDDTTIYQMNLDSVDALVSAAQSGLTEADTAEADTAAAETDADA